MENIFLEKNLDYEKRFLKLMGYTLIQSDKVNNWVIVDGNNSQVGFIQYTKCLKDQLPATSGFQTEINSDEIWYKAARKVNGKGSDCGTPYSFNIKREDGSSDKAEITLGEFPDLKIWSKENGFFRFNLDEKGLFFTFQSQTGNFNIEEMVQFKPATGDELADDKQWYEYRIKYCKKNLESSESHHSTTVKGICGSYDQYHQKPGQLKVTESTYVNGKKRTIKENEVEGTVEEMLVKHQMGIDSFKHFRYLVNKILPFQQEIMSVLLDGKIEPWLSYFLPELEQKKDLK